MRGEKTLLCETISKENNKSTLWELGTMRRRLIILFWRARRPYSAHQREEQREA